MINFNSIYSNVMVKVKKLMMSMTKFNESNELTSMMMMTSMMTTTRVMKMSSMMMMMMMITEMVIKLMMELENLAAKHHFRVFHRLTNKDRVKPSHAMK